MFVQQALTFLRQIPRRVHVAVVLGTAGLAAPVQVRKREALPDRMTRAAEFRAREPGSNPDTGQTSVRERLPTEEALQKGWAFDGRLSVSCRMKSFRPRPWPRFALAEHSDRGNSRSSGSTTKLGTEPVPTGSAEQEKSVDVSESAREEQMDMDL